jgi:hypothetical protein
VGKIQNGRDSAADFFFDARHLRTLEGFMALEKSRWRLFCDFLKKMAIFQPRFKGGRGRIG